MTIIFSYKGARSKSEIREDAVRRYNALIQSPTYVSLYYEDGVPYLTGDKSISITNTSISDKVRIEQIAISDETIGIDIERSDRLIKYDIASRYFEDEERAYIGDDNSRLLEVWMKKEAYGKSLKVGMYQDNVMPIDGYRSYEVYKGYTTMIYSKDKDIFFVAM